MIFLRSLFYLLVSLLLFNSCGHDKLPGKPLVSFNFNGSVLNKGLASVSVAGKTNVSYSVEKEDTCLDLSLSAKYRKPITVSFDDGFSLNDYDGFTVAVWVKKHPYDEEDYTIISHEKRDSLNILGWRIIVQDNGAWGWQLSDGFNMWEYLPTSQRQSVNDGEWHHIVFAYNGIKKEARLYYDATNVAVYSLWNSNLTFDSNVMEIGLDSGSKGISVDVFNGKLDDFALWSRPLSNMEIISLYNFHGNKRVTVPEMDDELKVMTWNIWNGGIHEGKYVGLKRIADIIKETGSDIVMLQEVYGAGAKIADELGFFMYKRSNNLCILSRYPISESHNLYRPENFGCIEIQLNEEDKVIACPVWLHHLPDIRAYVKSGGTVEDSIISREEQTRGKEARFILTELKNLMLRSDNIPVLIGGGFNSGSHLDWTEANRDNNFGLAVEYPVSKLMHNAGFTDSFREIYPDETKQLGRTWSPRHKNTIQDRIDYIYYHGDNLLPVNSFIVDQYKLGFPSDHAALVSVFRWENN